MLQTTTVQLTNGGSLRCARLGQGAPIVLLHGYPDNLQIWSRVAPLLAHHAAVVAVDWLGLVEGDAADGSVIHEAMADRLGQLLDTLGLARAHVVGFDLSGALALTFAARHPDRTAGLVISNALVDPDATTSMEIALSWRLGAYRIWLRWLPRVVMRRVEATSLPRGERLDADVREDVWSHFRQLPVRRRIIDVCAGYAAAMDALPALCTTIRCPVLALWAGQGRHFPLPQAEALIGRMSAARLEVLPEAKHWMIWSQPDDVAHSIGTFVKGSTSAAGRLE